MAVTLAPKGYGSLSQMVDDRPVASVSSFFGPMARRVSGEALKPEVFQEGLRMVRHLDPERAYICSLRKSDHLAVKAAYCKNGHNQEIGEYTLALWSEVLKVAAPTLQRGTGCWTVCAPIRDRNGNVSGLLYADSTLTGQIHPHALELILKWAEIGQKTAARRKKAGPRYKVGSRTFATMLSSLAVMLDAGLPLQRGLRQLAHNAEEIQAGALAQDLAEEIEKGRSFSSACRRHPRQFSALHVGLLTVAEATGGMDSMLKRLATFEEKRNATILKVKSALTYPAMLLGICSLGLLAAPPLLLESQFQLIRDLHVQPPLITELLMKFSALMRTPLPYLLVALAGLSGWLWSRKFFGDRQRQVAFTERLLGLSKVGELLRTLLTARFARALAVQMEAGVNIVDAITLAGKASGSAYMENVAANVTREMIAGRSLSVSLKRSGFFRPLFLSVIHSGESTGTLPKLTGWLADMGDEEVDQAIETVVSIVEPFIMVGMGGIVATMVVATMLPLSKALEAL